MASWDTDLVLMTRVLVSDMSTPQTYADEYIQRVLVTAGIMVDSEIPFSYDYSYDISALTISPDPVTNEDLVFMALIPLKAACILTQGEFKQALGQGIKVRDGDSAIDTSVSFRGYRDILELGPCAAYDKLKWTLLASGADSAGGVGKAVLGPYRIPGGSALSTISWYYDRFATGETGRRDR
ncbi:hypothetical protein LCGC14_0426350 [marine sediment metagenome]|uniref:Uncharacterized protein n=1 Tax=marine sediment metagenome TaxID=412755 RepID=A0A0F9T7D8_9ZZZZ